MRCPDLDRKIYLDNNIGKMKEDHRGKFRIINGKKIYQIEELSQGDRDMNLIINRVRASGMTTTDYFRKYHG